MDGGAELASGQEGGLVQFRPFIPIGSGDRLLGLQLPLYRDKGLCNLWGPCGPESLGHKMSGLWQDHEPQGWPAAAATSGSSPHFSPFFFLASFFSSSSVMATVSSILLLLLLLILCGIEGFSKE